MTDPNGLYYMRARYYHTGIKRFLNRDVLRGSMVEGQTLNRFGYVNGDPVSFIDPFGLEALSGCSKNVNNSDEFTVTLEFKEGMNRRDFDRKAKFLERMSNEGRLSRAKNPVKRDPYLTRKYKKDVTKRIMRMYGSKNPEKAKELADRVSKMNPDHMWDLQLNGPDVRRNLKLLDGQTNQELGRMIWNQIQDVKKVPVGTKIKIIVLR